MAERRRRKCNVNENSDDSEDSADEQPINNSSNQGSDAGNSEYESFDEEELAEDGTPDGEERQLAPPTAEDAEEKLDHDEDRKNPQYIPKKGTFYEHDDRTMEGGEETVPDDNVSEKSAPQDKETKKKVWKEDGKWQHDRYTQFDQSPKSKEELVATYGYDIRNEEGPPRARRRRRYGRGPNKYTRNWEDMDAYSKPTRGGKVEGRGGGGGRGRGRKNNLPNEEEEEEEYPALSVHQREEKDEAVIEPHRQVTVPSTEIDSPKMISSPKVISETYENIRVNKNFSGVGDQSSRVYIDDQRRDTRGTGRGSRPNRKTRPGSKGIPRNQNYSEGGQYMNKVRMDLGRGRGEGKPRMMNRGGHTPAHVSHMQHIYHSQDVQDVTEELKTVTITPSLHKEDHHYKKKNIDTRRATIPPRLQDSMRGNKSGPNHGGDANSLSKPKRYSSQRQRPMPDQMGQYHHPQGYYDQTGAEPDYNKMYERANSSPGTGTASQISLPTHAPPPSFVAPSFTATSTNTFPPAPRLFPNAPSQPHLIGPPVAGPPIVPPVTGPVVSGPPVPGTVGGPPVTGPPFLPPENMINYAAGAPALVAAPHPPQFPPFQTFTPVSQQQPQEIYSNGVTYYNTQSQQHLPRINPVLQKRPKAAIPIVPPPDRRNPKEEDMVDYGHMRDTSDSGNESSAVHYPYERETSDSYKDSTSDQYSDVRETTDMYDESAEVQYSDEREASDSYNESSDVQYSDDYASEKCNESLDQEEIDKSEEPIDNNQDSTLSPSCTSESNLETSEQSPQISPTSTEQEKIIVEKEIIEEVVLEEEEIISCNTEKLEEINEPNFELINGEDKTSSSPETETKDTSQLEDKSISNIEKSPSDITTEEESEVTNSPLDTT